jgi:intracellular sulfur oxidation DsrE/DsrF family protein
MSARSESVSPRRGFLGRLAAATVALAGASGVARADTLTRAHESLGFAPDEKWLDGLKGKHRQYFDAVAVNEGVPVIYAVNWLDTMKATYQVADTDLNAVVGLRHFSIPMGFTDAVWAKYPFGDQFKIMDPETKQPAKRNPYFHSKPGDLMIPGAAIEKLLARGTTFVMCNVAFTIASGMFAAAMKVDPATVKQDWMAGLIPGITLVPSGVLAVNRAQSKGRCTYCFCGV